MPDRQHELEHFIHVATEKMSGEYRRIQARATEDPGTAGDQGEENWAELLRSWLPSNYRVVTKGRILGHTGKASPQVDVIVLHPSYPPLLDSTKMYLAGGVVAVFECKLTLKAEHVRAAFETAAIIRRLLPFREGSPHNELYSPIIFGILSHSHSWNSEKSTPLENIGRYIYDSERAFSSHPRELVDLICVSDLTTWYRGHMVWNGPYLSYWEEESKEQGYPDEGIALTYYFSTPESLAIGGFLTRLLAALAWEDVGLRRIVNYFQDTAFSAPRSARGGRQWPIEIYSSSVSARIRSGILDFGEKWSEWNYIHA